MSPVRVMSQVWTSVILRDHSAGFVSSNGAASSEVFSSIGILYSCTRWYEVHGLSWKHVIVPWLFEDQLIALVVAVNGFNEPAGLRGTTPRFATALSES